MSKAGINLGLVAATWEVLEAVVTARCFEGLKRRIE
jgi:hypothetical protein